LLLAACDGGGADSDMAAPPPFTCHGFIAELPPTPSEVTCQPGQVCVVPMCCPLEVPHDDAGVCPAGTHEPFPSSACLRPCTPAPPHCDAPPPCDGSACECLRSDQARNECPGNYGSTCNRRGDPELDCTGCY
jgi:hypothetical protein